MFRSIVRVFIPLITILPAAGCASIVDGSMQTLSVQTVAEGQSVPGASCSLKSNKGTWFVTTPGTVTVHRGYDRLNVRCDKAGYQPAIITAASTTKGMAFGNLLFGGLIGAGVDMSTGAAYDYPKMISVPLTPQPPATAAAAAPPATAPTAQPVD